MRSVFTKLWLLTFMVLSVTLAQPKRPDAVWANQVANGSVTLDGVLSEAAWATADSIVLIGRTDGSGGDPTSGWVNEGGKANGADPINATFKFLVTPNGKMYMAVNARDKSIGGGNWAQFDALLMNMRDKKWRDQATGMASPYEFFYGWVSEGWADPNTNKGIIPPGFFGWSNGHRDSLCTHERDKGPGVKNKDVWNAVTKVLGSTNDDSTSNSADTAWVTEFEFDLVRRGYDVTRTGGEIIMFTVSLWDADYRHPLDTAKFSSSRSWLQGPWGNASANGHVRIFTGAGSKPASLPYDMTIYNGKNIPAPVIDGKLSENMWVDVPSFDIKFGDLGVRNSYKNTIPHRSGQFQPEVLGKRESIVDPANANVKMFFKEDTLYVGVKVSDKNVQFHPSFDRQDGFRFMPKSRTERDGDRNLVTRELQVSVDTSAKKYVLNNDAKIMTSDTLGAAKNGSRIILSLGTGTTVDTVGAQVDNGYTIEMKFNLRALGYAAGRSDGLFWFGALVFDGDFGASSSVAAYGNRVWIAQEGGWPDGPLCAYMDPNAVVSVNDKNSILPKEFELHGAYPNPFNPSTKIEFSLPQFSNVRIQVYDILGRVVSEKTIHGLSTGRQAYNFNATGLTSGSYIYRVEMLDFNTNEVMSTKVGKLILMK